MITRRQLNLMGAATATALLTRADLLCAEARTPLDSFMTASQAITGRSTLDRTIGTRFLAALEAANPGFSSVLSNLAAALETNVLDAAQQGTVLAIMKAWYTGMVGRTVVTFEKALMFEAVADVLPVRSYCGGKPNFWAENPNKS